MQSVRAVSQAMSILLLVSLATMNNAHGLSLKSGKLASLTQSWKQLVAGAGLLAITCTGCSGKIMLNKKYAPVQTTVAITSFVAQIPLGVLASQEKLHPAFAIAATGIFAANFLFMVNTEFDYGEGGFHAESGGVDWYGMNNTLYSEIYILGIRVDGQQQFAARQPELEPYNFNYVLVHIHDNGRDYAAVVKPPWQPRRRAGPPYGLQGRIRYPSNRPPPPKPHVTVVDSLQPHDYSRIPLDSVMGIYLTDHPDYKRDEWVVIEDGERLLYGKITHHFSSNHAQVRILAVREGDSNLVMLPENKALYRVYPQERLQRAEDVEEVN